MESATPQLKDVSDPAGSRRPRAIRLFWGGLALGHLLMVAFGASQVRLPPGGSVQSAFEQFFGLYGTLTGASAGFNYFAPEIGSELRARFEITDAQGRVYEDTLHAGAGREVFLRVHNIVGLIAGAIYDEERRRRIAASWAGKMFARHPDATKVRVILESFELPSMEATRKGARAHWALFYSGTFARKARVSWLGRNG